MKKSLGSMCAGAMHWFIGDIVWHGFEDICPQHGSLNCGCEKTAETEWPAPTEDENEPF
jgi:hypothetical protein